MRLLIDIPDEAMDVIGFWAKLDGKTPEEHLEELLRSDIRLTIRALETEELDALLNLDGLTVRLSPSSPPLPSDG